MDSFTSYNVEKFQEYLKERGVTYSKLKKNELVELTINKQGYMNLR